VTKCSLNHRLTKDSATLLIELVTEIGRMSFSTVAAGKRFGNGVILDSFQLSGTIPCLIDELIIEHIGADREKANLCKILFGNRSGPGDLFGLSLSNTL